MLPISSFTRANLCSTSFTSSLKKEMMSTWPFSGSGCVRYITQMCCPRIANWRLVGSTGLQSLYNHYIIYSLIPRDPGAGAPNLTVDGRSPRALVYRLDTHTPNLLAASQGVPGFLFQKWRPPAKAPARENGRGFACDFSRGSLVTSQFGSLVTSCFLWSRNAELSSFSENRVTPNP